MRIPILPVLSREDLTPGAKSTLHTVLQVGTPMILDRGSSAILLALHHAGVKPGDEVLVPAFNCPSMVEPVKAAAAVPVFYGIQPDLVVTIAELESKLTARTRAVLVPHFFAKLQRLDEARALCESRGLLLIEDCAHAFFGSSVGSTGHVTIASPRKFFPLSEGGLLTSAGRDLSRAQASRAPFGKSARIAFDSTQAALARGRPASIPVSRMPTRGSAFTRYMLPRMTTQRMVERRWSAYEQLVSAAKGMRGIEVLDLKLPRTSVPYMLPVLLSAPERQFPRIKASGVPIWRWEHSAAGHCKVTDWYARALIQVPCHQSLRPGEIQYIAQTLRAVGEAP